MNRPVPPTNFVPAPGTEIPVIDAPVVDLPIPAGAVDDATGTPFTSVEYYDPKVKARAYKLYLETDLSIADIAVDVGAPSVVIAKWARAGDWRLRKQEIEDELFRRAEDGYRALIIKHRAPVIDRHIRVAGKIETAVEEVMDKAKTDERSLNSMELKRMAETLAAAAGVSARAAGISDKPFSDVNERAGEGKRPLVLLNINPAPAPGQPPVTVETREV